MASPWLLYELLVDYASLPDPVEEVLIGPVWTLCRTAQGIGLAMSPRIPCRTLEWPGTLCGRTLAELATWVREFEPYAATVGMAAVNAALCDLSGPPESRMVAPSGLLPANLAVFEHFLPDFEGQRVAVVGRYPGLDALARHCRLTVLERQPGPGDLPDPAAEYVLPEADWVFLTASSLTNKTFPRLAELARPARTVLLGPTLPWLPELADYGIDFLAGVDVVDPAALRRIVAEGGGVRIFGNAVRYRVAALDKAHCLAWLEGRGADLHDRVEVLNLSKASWCQGHDRPFPDQAKLDSARRRLCRLNEASGTQADRQPEPR